MGTWREGNKATKQHFVGFCEQEVSSEKFKIQRTAATSKNRQYITYLAVFLLK
jgi:hypothetical protein